MAFKSKQFRITHNLHQTDFMLVESLNESVLHAAWSLFQLTFVSITWNIFFKLEFQTEILIKYKQELLIK